MSRLDGSRFGSRSNNIGSFPILSYTWLLSSCLQTYVSCLTSTATCHLRAYMQGLNTTGTLVSICQNDKFSFSFLQNTYLGLAQAITSTISTLGFWYIQRYWKIPTKTMFVVTNVVTILIPLWGMIGIWTGKLGFHNVWEFWAYNVVFGLFQAPYYAFSQTMMAELTPPGFDNMVRTRSFDPTGGSEKHTAVLRAVRAVEPRIVHDWTQCHPGHHRQDGRQLEGIPVPLRAVCRRESRHLVRYVPFSFKYQRAMISKESGFLQVWM